MSLLNVDPVVLITGISAAGKSTVAEQLARRFERGVHVRGDVFRRMVVSGRVEMTDPASDEAWQQLRLRYRLSAETANTYHRAGFAVVVQDVVIGDVLAEYVSQLAGRPIVVVVLAPSPQIVAERERGRSKVAYRDSLRDIQRLDLALREETPRLGMWIDSSNQSPEETVQAIVEDGLQLGSIA